MSDLTGARRGPTKLVVFTSTEEALEPRLFFKVARTAAAAGYDVTLIGRHPADEVRDGVQIRAVRSSRNRLERILFTSWKVFLQALSERGDVYHFSAPELVPFALLLQTLRRRPVIYDLREYHGQRIRQKGWLPRFLREPLARLYEWIAGVLVRRLAGVVTVNEDLASRQRARGCTVAVVPNYAPRSIFTADAPRDRADGPPIVIYVGAVGKERGILNTVRAMTRVRESIPDARLWLVGPSHQAEYMKRIRREIRELGLDDAVRLVGAVPHTEVPVYLARAHVGLCLLLPVCEGYKRTEPIKYFEYAAAGLPEVVSDLPALRRLVEVNRNGVAVDPTNPASIADGIIRTLSDRAAAAEMGENGRRAFLETYNWEEASKALLATYRRVLRRVAGDP